MAESRWRLARPTSAQRVGKNATRYIPYYPQADSSNAHDFSHCGEAGVDS
jgi:hypothetical protein